MNKSESKYFNTAARMDEALLTLLERKDFQYITVKEICAQAGVNRSTFYLHYETIDDLLCESVQYMTEQFLAHMNQHSVTFVLKIKDCPLDALYLMTPKYLMPYLGYIAKHKRLFRTAVEHAGDLRLDGIYGRMLRHIFTPILERFQVPQADQAYLMAFYIHGLMAILSEWLRQDCADSIAHVCAVMEQCVMHGRTSEEKTE